MSDARRLRKVSIANRAAQEVRDGEVVNLGIGIPVLAAEFLRVRPNVDLHTENGMLGVKTLVAGDAGHPDRVNAGKARVDAWEGASYFDSSLSFGMIRAGHVDVAIVGALEVDESGILANWNIPGSPVLGVGGAMDLLAGVRRVIVATEHLSSAGEQKLVRTLRYPMTSTRPVDVIVTELATFDVVDSELWLRELVGGVDVGDVRAVCGSRFRAKHLASNEGNRDEG